MNRSRQRVPMVTCAITAGLLCSAAGLAFPAPGGADPGGPGLAGGENARRSGPPDDSDDSPVVRPRSRGSAQGGGADTAAPPDGPCQWWCPDSIRFPGGSSNHNFGLIDPISAAATPVVPVPILRGGVPRAAPDDHPTGAAAQSASDPSPAVGPAPTPEYPALGTPAPWASVPPPAQPWGPAPAPPVSGPWVEELSAGTPMAVPDSEQPGGSSASAVPVWTAPPAAPDPVTGSPATSTGQPLRMASGRAEAVRLGYPEELRNADLTTVAATALPGLAAMAGMTALGGFLGYRQAKAGSALRAGADGYVR